MTENPEDLAQALEATYGVEKNMDTIFQAMTDFSEKLKRIIPSTTDIQKWVNSVKGTKFQKETAEEEMKKLRQLLDLAECTFEINNFPVRVRITKNRRSQYACLQFWRMDNGKQIFEYNGSEFPDVKVIKIKKT